VKATSGTKPGDFRDQIATADRKGRRLWVYPLQPKGRLYTARTLVALALLAFFFVAPFIRVNGQPLILLDFLNRNFVLLGLVFKPQDFYLLVLAILTVLVFIVQFTAIFGRLFCGWVCPQTIFMEMVFRRIEYLIDGGPAGQRQLREGPWTGEKTIKWLLKQAVFLGVSFVVCNFLLAYIIGADSLLRIIRESPLEHLLGLAGMLVFTFVFYGVFSWFREQVCTLVCPYGRLQGVLLDSNSIQVAYDYTRGEPRAKFKRGEDRVGNGDCVMCRACVAVCPTGIDIRNGTQLECVNCAACIDACNAVMRRVSLPEGLIRYTSEDRLKGHRGWRMSGRVMVYTLALAVLVSLLSYLLVAQSDVEVTILRTPGTLYYETEAGTIRNLYSLKLVNKISDEIPIQLRLVSPVDGHITMIAGDMVLKPGGVAETAFFVDIPGERLYAASTRVTIEVAGAGRVLDEVTTAFMGPDPGGEK